MPVATSPARAWYCWLRRCCRYDAEQTVAGYAASLKDTVDLESVREDLALEPAHLSLWTDHRTRESGSLTGSPDGSQARGPGRVSGESSPSKAAPPSTAAARPKAAP